MTADTVVLAPSGECAIQGEASDPTPSFGQDCQSQVENLTNQDDEGTDPAGTVTPSEQCGTDDTSMCTAGVGVAGPNTGNLPDPLTPVMGGPVTNATCEALNSCGPSTPPDIGETACTTGYACASLTKTCWMTTVTGTYGTKNLGIIGTVRENVKWCWNGYYATFSQLGFTETDGKLVHMNSIGITYLESGLVHSSDIQSHLYKGNVRSDTINSLPYRYNIPSHGHTKTFEFNFSWTPDGYRNPSSPDGSWSNSFASIKFNCVSNRSQPCQFG